MTGQDPVREAVEIDTGRPHPARMYDWLLGGKDNYPVDEELARKVIALDPRGRVNAKVNRAFMHRTTRWLAERGIRQFLDIGTGIPTEPNLHQIAQRTAPEARVVYCDNDPIVLAHAAALLRSSPQGATEYVQADVREPDVILERAAKVLDFGAPVALSLMALIHFVPDEEGAHELVDHLVGALPSGSYLALSHATADFAPEQSGAAGDKYRAGGISLVLRSREQVARFFHGLDIVEPGIVVPDTWHPELGDPVPGQDDGPIALYGGVARKR
jgi:O-methyltransferase involved in polyketide biosynthesis